MCSTPEPIIASCTPAATRAAEKLTACCAEPHCLSIVVPGVSIGRPSCSQALRAMLKPCSPNCWTQPATTSSTSRGSMPAREIACGLAATAAHHGPVLLLARSESSADRARATVEKTLSGLGAEIDGAAAAGDGQHVQIVTDPAALAPASFVVEAVVEDEGAKA